MNKENFYGISGISERAEYSTPGVEVVVGGGVVDWSSVQAHILCQGVRPCTWVSFASHVVGPPLGAITWNQLFLVWCAHPPASKAWLPPKWELALYPKETIMLLHMFTDVAASWTWHLRVGISAMLETTNWKLLILEYLCQVTDVALILTCFFAAL